MTTAPYSLSKDAQQVSLEATVTQLRVGVAWSASGSGTKGLAGKLRRKKGVDLDLLCVASQGPNAKRLCWFDHTDCFENGSLITMGDNTTGKGDGDDESIIADFTKIPNVIDRLTFIVMAYKPGVDFTKVSGVTVSVYDHVTGIQRGAFMPNIGERKNAIVAAQAVRVDGTHWKVIELDEMVNIAVNGNLGSDQASIVAAARRYSTAV